MTDFIPGLRLSEAFYREAVAPILARELPGLVQFAARIGTRSDALGFDTVRSTDREWAPRIRHFLFVDATDVLSNPDLRRRMRATFSERL